MIQVVVLSRLGIAVGRDALDGEAVSQFPLRGKRRAHGLGLVLAIQVGNHLQCVTGVDIVLAEIVERSTRRRPHADNVEQGGLPALYAGYQAALLRPRGLVCIRVVQVQVHREGIAGQPAELGDGVEPILVQVLVVEELVVHVAIAGDHGNGKARPQRFGERDIEYARRVQPVVVSDPGLHRTLERVHRPVGCENQCPASCVLAEQRTLRPPQHLHRLDVIEVQQGPVRTPDVYLVDVYAHAGVDVDLGVALADTANIDIGQGSRAVGLVDVQVGRYRVQVLEVADAGVPEGGRIQRRNGHRGFLQALLASTRGDDNFLEYALLGSDRLRQDRKGCDDGKRGKTARGERPREHVRYLDY